MHIHPTGTCEEDEAIVVGYVSGSSYTFTEEDAGNELFFACDVGRRCESGQNMKVAVSSAPADAQINGIENAVNSAAAANGNGVFSASLVAAGFAATMML